MPRQNLGSTTVCQIAVVVRDIEKTARAYAEVFGLPVPPVRETAPLAESHAEYRGQPTEGRAKLAFFQMGQVSIELIEPIGGPSTWREHLDRHGEGVHHIAFQVQGMKDTLSFLASKDIPLVQKGEFTGGRYAYVDSLPQLKVVLELLESDKRA